MPLLDAIRRRTKTNRVTLRNKKGQPIPFVETDATRQLHILLDRLAEKLASHVIMRQTANGPVRLTEFDLDPEAIFNRRLDLGGRIYGAWQGLSKAERAGLLIDGQSTDEIDFSACHGRLLLAAIGKMDKARNLAFDPYEIPGLEDKRDSVKLAIIIGVYASNAHQALFALARKLERDGLAPPHAADAEAERLLAAVLAAYPRLAALWASGLALKMQNIDSGMCRRVIELLLAASIPVLPVHDSWVVPAEHRAALQEAMDAALAWGLAEAVNRIGPRVRFYDRVDTNMRALPSSQTPTRRDPPAKVIRQRAERLRITLLEPVLLADPRPLPGRIRLGVKLIGAIYVLLDATDLAARTAKLFKGCGLTAPVDRVQAIVADEIAKPPEKRFRITKAGAFKLAAPPPDMAEQLAELLSLKQPLSPAERRAREARRSQKRRRRRKAPERIVPNERAGAWRLKAGMSRAEWYRQHDAIERQVLSLRAFIFFGDTEAIAKVEATVAARGGATSWSQLVKMLHEELTARSTDGSQLRAA